MALYIVLGLYLAVGFSGSLFLLWGLLKTTYRVHTRYRSVRAQYPIFQPIFHLIFLSVLWFPLMLYAAANGWARSR